jgi:hypothetical protein
MSQPLHFDFLPATPCVECKRAANHANLADEVRAPAPGDRTLCLNCGSLNVIDEHLTFRAPTVDEFLEVAKDPDVQRLRRTILKLKQTGKRKHA